jgi:hypothetical protein
MNKDMRGSDENMQDKQPVRTFGNAAGSFETMLHYLTSIKTVNSSMQLIQSQSCHSCQTIPTSKLLFYITSISSQCGYVCLYDLSYFT